MEEEKKEEKATSENTNEETATKKVKEKINFNKFNSTLISLFEISIVVLLIICLLELTNTSVSNYMWLNIDNKIFAFVYSFMQNFSFITPYLHLILISLCIILSVGNIALLIIFRKNIKLKTSIFNMIMPFNIVLGFILLFNAYYFFSLLSHRGINEIYLNDKINEEYKEEDLDNLIDYFKNNIIVYAESLNRTNNMIVFDQEPYDMAKDNIKNLTVKYDFLKGNFPKVHNFTENELEFFSYPLSITFNYIVSIDETSLTDLNKIFTLSREFCHVKGIYRESDANYCAFLALYNSNDDVSKYSMYLNILPRLMNISKNKQLTKSIEDEFGSMCLESNYDEICNFNNKDLYRFKKGSNQLELYTYSLNIYKNNKEELKQYLLGLSNRFKISITTSNNEKISLEDSYKLIDSESDNTLYLVGDIDEKTYKDNMQYLKTISYYFPYLYLRDKNEKINDYSSFNYLKKFPTNNFASLKEKEPEFGYDRVVRSILEYFNIYVYN